MELFLACSFTVASERLDVSIIADSYIIPTVIPTSAYKEMQGK